MNDETFESLLELIKNGIDSDDSALKGIANGVCQTLFRLGHFNYDQSNYVQDCIYEGVSFDDDELDSYNVVQYRISFYH